MRCEERRTPLATLGARQESMARQNANERHPTFAVPQQSAKRLMSDDDFQTDEVFQRELVDRRPRRQNDSDGHIAELSIEPEPNCSLHLQGIGYHLASKPTLTPCRNRPPPVFSAVPLVGLKEKSV